MLDLDSVNRYIHTWIQNTLSVEQPKLGGWAPCPYAHMARWNVLGGTWDITHDLMRAAEWWTDQYDVTILAYDSRAVRPQYLTQAVDEANYNFLAPANLVALEDHPDSPESVNGVSFNNGLVALIMIQSYDKLERATRMLKRTDYYDRWPREYYDQVVGARERLAGRVMNQPRSQEDGLI